MNHSMRAKKTQRRGEGKLDVKWELRVVSGGREGGQGISRCSRQKQHDVLQ